ncbi:tail fiber protein / tail tubular protein A [Enterobacter phage 01_vB_Eclo_IJM]|nr:tail fiber protein / tail tubular protein A [Enterobacter phage 01_vB_Eclo_IJM]
MENFIVVNSAGAYNRMYIYKFRSVTVCSFRHLGPTGEFEPGEKVAPAAIGSTIFIVKQSPQGVDIEHLRFIKEATDMDNEPYRLHLDSKATMYIQPNTYNPDTFVTLVDMGRLMVVQLLKGNYFMVDDQGAYVSGAAGRSKSVNIR